MKKKTVLNVAFWIVVLSLLAVILNGCVTERACARKFPADTVTTVMTVYRDTIVPVYIEKTDTVFSYGTIRDTVIVRQGTAHAISYVIRDTLKLFLWQTDTTLMVRLDSALKHTETQNNIINTYRVKYVPKIYKHALGICIFLFAGVVVFMFFKFKKYFL